jgi:hypothetical protein
MDTSEGQRQMRQAAGRLPIQKYPWGQIALNVAGITGAHALGYYTAGALAHALSKTRLGRSFGRLPPTQQQRALAHIIGAAGSAGVISGSLASIAGQQRIAEHLAKKQQQQQSKVASVRSIYREALEKM